MVYFIEFINLGIITFILFALYLQYSPSIGNIWIRPDHTGEYVFCPRNLFDIIIIPFKDIQFWNVKVLDLNFFFWILCVFSLHILLCSIKQV